MNNELAPIQSNQSFPFYLRRSTYLHASILFLFLIGTKVAVEANKRMRDKNIELIQASVRVDVVSMPTQTLSELKKVSSNEEEIKEKPTEPTVLEEKPIEKNEDKPIEKAEEKPIEDEDKARPTFEEKNQNKRSNFLSKLKEIGHKEIKNTPTKKVVKGLADTKKNELKQLILAGNKLSNGVQIFGENSGRDMKAFQAYAAKLPDLVRPHWKLPSFLTDKNYQCRIRLWLSISGEVTRAEVYQSSGEKEYDQRAVDAIKSAAPFPKMGAEVGSRGIEGDILLGFPL